MKRLIGAAICCLLCCAATTGFAGGNPWEKKLPFAEATIRYQLSGSQEGTEEKYYRDHGRQMATYHTSTTTMMGMKVSNETVVIEDPEWIYTYDIKEKTGTKAANPVKFMAEEYGRLSEAEKKQVEKNAESLGTNMMQGMNGKVERKVTRLLGYDCDRTSMMGTTVYLIHDTPVALKTETDMMGMKMVSVATSVEEGKADAARFTHPAGIEAIHDLQADEMAKAMAAQTMAMLKNPDGMKGMTMPATGSGQQGRGPGSEDRQAAEQAGQLLKGILGN